MTTEYTSVLRLAKPEFRSPTWGPLMNLNMDAIDAAVTNAIIASNIEVWANSTTYSIGTIAMDDQVVPPTYWINTVVHTSPASPTTFAAYRAANPTRWTSVTFGITPRGEWANDTAYGYYDIAYDSSQGIVGLCLIPHTSSSAPDTIDDDVANWVFIVDMPSVGTTPASSVSYDNTGAALPGAPANVQAAIDALDTRVDNAATVVSALDGDVDVHETRLDALDISVAANTSDIATHETRLDTAESDIDSNTARLDDHDTTLAGLGSGFPATTAMLFWQAAAPTGWTKSTTHNDKALRVVSGTGGGNGGSSSFSTVFGKTATDGTTLTTGTIPGHTHSEVTGAFTGVGGSIDSGTGSGNITNTGATTGSAGSGGSHTHPIDLRVHYLDLIICTKD